MIPVRPPPALLEPTISPPTRWVVLLTVANIGLWAGFFGPIQVLLAQQSEAIAPAHKEQLLALVLGLGALTSVVVNPVAGAFSDRTTLRMGRRLPWIIGGTVGGAVALVFLSQADSVWWMVVGWCGVQASLNALLAAAVAMVPDQVPVSRRGRIGGIVAVATTFGVVGGTGIAALTGSIATGYVVTAAVLVLLVLPFCFVANDSVLPDEFREPFELGAFLRSFWVSPSAYPDFAWAWLTRFLVTLGNSIGLLYLLFFLQDVVGFSSDDADQRLFLLTGIYAGTLVLTTVVFGIWSDHLGRRKVFVIWSGLVAGLASALLGVGQSWPMSIVAAVVLGCSYGIYLSVDFAMITEVLPGAQGRAKDLGVINIASSLPQVLAPAVAAVLLGLVEATGGTVDTNGDGFSVGYLVLYGFAFLSSVLGSVFVTRIKGVR